MYLFKLMTISQISYLPTLHVSLFSIVLVFSSDISSLWFLYVLNRSVKKVQRSQSFDSSFEVY